MQSRLDITIRIVALIKALMAGWRTVDELCDISGGSRRTVYRYLNAIEAAHLPLQVERGEWREATRYRLARE